MGESTIAYKTKTNKKANYIAATGVSEATNFTIHTANFGNQFNFPVDQTKANWGKLFVSFVLFILPLLLKTINFYYYSI